MTNISCPKPGCDGEVRWHSQRFDTYRGVCTCLKCQRSYIMGPKGPFETWGSKTRCGEALVTKDWEYLKDHKLSKKEGPRDV